MDERHTFVFLSDLKPNSPCCCFWSVCAADWRTSGHLLHDLPGLCWWRAEPEVEAQASASHHGLSATAHGLFYQFRQHGYRGAQALQSPAWTTLRPGWVVGLLLFSFFPRQTLHPLIIIATDWHKSGFVFNSSIFVPLYFALHDERCWSHCKGCHVCLLQVFFTMSIWECLRFSAQTPSTSWQASMALSPVKLCVSPAPSSCSTCWSSVVCGLSLTVRFIQPWVCWVWCVIIVLLYIVALFRLSVSFQEVEICAFCNFLLIRGFSLSTECWACPLWPLVCCASGDYRDDHVFSLYFMIPFFFTTLALFYHNW